MTIGKQTILKSLNLKKLFHPTKRITLAQTCPKFCATRQNRCAWQKRARPRWPTVPRHPRRLPYRPNQPIKSSVLNRVRAAPARAQILVTRATIQTGITKICHVSGGWSQMRVNEPASIQFRPHSTPYARPYPHIPTTKNYQNWRFCALPRRISSRYRR